MLVKQGFTNHPGYFCLGLDPNSHSSSNVDFFCLKKTTLENSFELKKKTFFVPESFAHSCDFEHRAAGDKFCSSSAEEALGVPAGLFSSGLLEHHRSCQPAASPLFAPELGMGQSLARPGSDGRNGNTSVATVVLSPKPKFRLSATFLIYVEGDRPKRIPFCRTFALVWP